MEITEYLLIAYILCSITFFVVMFTKVGPEMGKKRIIAAMADPEIMDPIMESLGAAMLSYFKRKNLGETMVKEALSHMIWTNEEGKIEVHPRIGVFMDATMETLKMTILGTAGNVIKSQQAKGGGDLMSLLSMFGGGDALSQFAPLLGMLPPKTDGAGNPPIYSSPAPTPGGNNGGSYTPGV